MSTIFDRLKELEQSKRRSASTGCGPSTGPIKSVVPPVENGPDTIDTSRTTASWQRFVPVAVMAFGTAVIATTLAVVLSGSDDADRKIHTSKTIQAQAAMKGPVDDKSVEETMDETVASIRAMEFVEEITASGTVEPRGELPETIIAAMEPIGPATVEKEIEPAEQIALVEQPTVIETELSEETTEIEDIKKAIETLANKIATAEIGPITAGPVEEVAPQQTAPEEGPSTTSSLFAFGFINNKIAEKKKLISRLVHEEVAQDGPEHINDETADAETAGPAIVDEKIGPVEQIAIAQQPLAVKTEINEKAEEPTSGSAVENIPGSSPVAAPEKITFEEDTENKKIINALRKLRFSYLSDDSGRVALLDGRTVREGQKLKELVVRKIEPSGMILSCKNKVYRVIWSR
jgi:Type II secretion system protein B